MAFIMWNAVSGIAALVQTVLVLAALIYAIKQLKENARARGVSVMLQIFPEFDSLETSQLYYQLHNELPEDLTGVLADAHRRVIYQIIRQMDFLGFLARSGLVEIDLVSSRYYPRVIRAWQRIGPKIAGGRNEGAADYGIYFEWLAEKCLRYHEATNPGVVIRAFRED
jgi:hypothetical protein